jgi:tetratricopeptide (TPR) repeat protein
LKSKYNKNEEKMISELNLAPTTEDLLKMLEKITKYCEDQATRLVDVGQFNEAADKRKMTARAYDLAAELMEKEPRFASSKNVSETLRATANSWYNKAESRPEVLEDLHKKAYESISTQDYEKAIGYLDKMLEVYPDDAEIWLEKGNCLYSLGKYTAAVSCYQKCLMVNKDEINAVCNMGLALYNLGRYAEALKCLDSAVDKARRIGNALIEEFALVVRGYSYLQLERHDDAEKSLLDALELNEKSIESMEALSSVYTRKFEYAKAAQYAEKALKQAPDKTGIKAGLAEFLLASEEYEKRERLVDEVLAKAPDKYGYPMRLIKACSLYFRGKTDEAIKTAFDLIEYYYSIPVDYPRNWHYKGLKNMIKNKEISEQVKNVLFSFITIAETNDELVKKEELSKLPVMIKASKGKLDTSEGGIAFKKRAWPTVIIRNTAKPDKDRPGWYDWEIFLAPPEALDKVDRVTYTLHETFFNPVRTMTNRHEDFRLKRRGWGEFRVKAEIHFKDGNREETVTKYHWLELGPTPLDND